MLKKNRINATFVLKNGDRIKTTYDPDTSWDANDFTEKVIHRLFIKEFLSSPKCVFISGHNISHVIMEPKS